MQSQLDFQYQLNQVIAMIQVSNLSLKEIAERIGKSRKWLSSVVNERRLPNDLNDIDRLRIVIKAILEERLDAIERISDTERSKQA